MSTTGSLLYNETGVLFGRPSPPTPGTYEGDSMSVLGSLGLRTTLLSQDDMARRFPATRGAAPFFSHGYLSENGGVAHPQRSVAWMAEQARAAGVTFLLGIRGQVVKIERDGRVASVRTADGLLHVADAVIVAAGPWSPALLPELYAFTIV